MQIELCHRNDGAAATIRLERTPHAVAMYFYKSYDDREQLTRTINVPIAKWRKAVAAMRHMEQLDRKGTP